MEPPISWRHRDWTKHQHAAGDERKFQFRDDFTMQAGNHGLKFGTNYIYTKLDGFFFFGSSGYTIGFFDSPAAIVAAGGFNRPGLVNFIQFATGEASHKQTLHQLAFYVQDDWKVRPNLTFNLGLALGRQHRQPSRPVHQPDLFAAATA
jgi:outer membrane receptor protein involved in Fe transport